ncbi:hypothetical protein [Comamonas jiangduensis]|uniref:hypothetical protein n=2 Tax=Comamonas jiangduensis TaxID=1194168 RepID=UPI003BF892D9
MKFQNISKWKISPEIEGLLFFAQRMDELLWKYTLDTYKPAALNAPFLCSEVLSIIKNIENELIDEQNLSHVVEELIWSIKNDKVAKKLLDMPIDFYIKIDDQSKLSEKRLKIEALQKTLSPFRYLNQCFQDLIISINEIKKQEIENLSRNITTTLINMGVSKQSLSWKLKKYFFSSDGKEIEHPSQIIDFLQNIYPYSHEFHVYFVVSDLIKSVKESLDAFSIEIIDNIDEIQENKTLELIKLQDDLKNLTNECFVRVGPFSGLDVYSAHSKAIKYLDQLSDLFTLFYHRKQISWRPKAIVEQCCLDRPVATILNNGPMDKPFDFNADKASKELNKLLINFSLRGSSRDRFNRVTDLHGICVSADVVDNQLVTLWTSLETLIPSKAGKSKINNIINGAVPFLSINYIYRIVERFSHDLFTWNKWKARKILKKTTKAPNSDFTFRCFLLLSQPENNELRNELYAELRDFHLLRFRAFQISDLLSNKEKILNRINLHETKVKWQLRRIYRTRNLLVHSGSRSSYIETLVENAHEYLDQITFSAMMISCDSYQATSLDQIFEISNLKYQKLIKFLKNEGPIRADDYSFIKNNSDNLRDYRNEYWTEKP